MKGNSKIIHKKFDAIPTTQDEIKKYTSEITPDTWVLCTAEEQTKGRGTHNRRWASPPNVNIYATYGFLIPNKQIAQLKYIPQITALAVAMTLQSLNLKNKISLKWVNDVLMDYKKICGILCEIENNTTHSGYYTVYLGVGLNINMDKTICDSLDQPVTSLQASTGKKFDKLEILTILNQNIQKNINLLIQKGIEPFFEMVLGMLEKFSHEEIYFDTENENFKPRVFKATIIGINERFELVVKPQEHVIGYLDVTPDSDQTLSFMTGRILRGKEISNYLESLKNKQDEKQILHSSLESRAINKNVLCKYKWPLLGTLGAAAAIGFLIWSRQSGTSESTNSDHLVCKP